MYVIDLDEINCISKKENNSIQEDLLLYPLVVHVSWKHKNPNSLEQQVHIINMETHFKIPYFTNVE